MKPGDIFYFDKSHIDILKKNTLNAEKYWNNLFNSIKPIQYKVKTFNFLDLKYI